MFAPVQIFARVAPQTLGNRHRHATGDVENADPNYAWHAEHGKRIKWTHEFFNSWLTVPRLIIFLKVLVVEQIILAWLMAHDNHHFDPKKTTICRQICTRISWVVLVQ